jgi:hypothetical protein
MSKKRRWLAMLSIASLFIAVGGCSDDDDDVIQAQEVSANQAENLIEGAVPFILEFGTDLADLLEAVYAPKVGDWNKQAECVPIPGIEAEFFCTDPADGEVCSTSETESEWVFNNCVETGMDPGTLDGTVAVTASGNTYDLDFNLDVDGGSMTGLLQVLLGECVTVTYTGFEIEEDDVRNTIDGTTEVCPESYDGTIDVTVNATGIQRFLMEITFFNGVPTIVIVSPSTQMPLYTCTYNPLSETAQCFPVTGT